MKLGDSVKPISYVKGNAAQLVREVADNHSVYIITQNGEAKAVLQGIDDYEQTQETLAMLKILALGRKDVEEGNVTPVRQAFDELRDRIDARRKC